MKRLRLPIVTAILMASAAVVCAESALAQDGKLKIRVTPTEAYVFVDGDAIRDGKQAKMQTEPEIATQKATH